MLEQIPCLKQIFVQSLFQHAQLGSFPLCANSHTALQIASIGCEFVYLLSLCKAGLRHVDKPRIGLCSQQLKTNVVFQKGKEKEKEKKKKKNKIVKFCFETRARSKGYMAKAFETRCPKP